jgi:pimeloyl-ACP methyl ester carboxylesterase
LIPLADWIECRQDILIKSDQPTERVVEASVAESTPTENGPAAHSIGVEVATVVHLKVLSWAVEGEPRTAAADAAFVLLHGIASTSDSWSEVGRWLALGGRKAYALDFRGHGMSDRPEGGYDLATYASDLAAVIARLGLTKPILVGHSLGANVILEAVSARPDIAGGVVLVEGGLADARDQFATLEECMAKIALAPVAGMPLPRLQGYLRATHPDWSEARLAATIAAFDIHADGTVSWRLTAPRFDALLRALWTDTAADRWSAVHAPAVVVAADNGDAAWTAAKRAAEARIREAIPGVRVEWFTADHDVHAARPDDLARLLLEAFPSI